MERSHFTLEHLQHLPLHKLRQTCILIEILAGPLDTRPEPFRILIDGTHRAARCMLESRACWAYLLTEEEQRWSPTLPPERAAAYQSPTLPVPGVSDHEAARPRHRTGNTQVA